jgi:hypothetical protein
MDATVAQPSTSTATYNESPSARTDDETQESIWTVSVNSPGSTATLIDGGLKWSKSISDVLDGHTVEAAAKIVNEYNIKCSVKVFGKTPGIRDVYFYFGTENNSPYAACGSVSAMQRIPVNEEDNWATYSQALYAVIGAIEQPKDRLLKSLLKGWPKDKKDLTYFLKRMGHKICNGLGPLRDRSTAWDELTDADLEAQPL